MKDIRIAAVITNSPLGEIRRNLDAVCQWVRMAKAGGAGIVCFPEMNVTGYSSQNPVRDFAQPIPGPVSEELALISAREKMVVLAGMAEKDRHGEIFASHVVLLPGQTPKIYRKLHIAPPEEQVFSSGNHVPLFYACGVTFGIQLCYDAHFPELTTCMAANGADLVFMPHASPRGVALQKHTSWLRHLPARAFDNSLFVVACNQSGENGAGLDFPGNGVVFDPSGKILATALGGGETILFADLKAADLERVRNHRMRYFFPNRRPGLYRSNL
jgi:predicted amidohydrolase